jgi:hypothetical protein
VRTPARRPYRAILIPSTINFDEVEFQADQGLLPTHEIRAPNADIAAADAFRETGKAVLRVERIEGRA